MALIEVKRPLFLIINPRRRHQCLDISTYHDLIARSLFLLLPLPIHPSTSFTITTKPTHTYNKDLQITYSLIVVNNNKPTVISKMFTLSNFYSNYIIIRTVYELFKCYVRDVKNNKF